MLYRLLTSGGAIDLSRAPKIGEGGEARVYEVLKLGLAVKIYHRPHEQHRRKLVAMVANPPTDPTAAGGHVSIAWPRDLLLDAQGRFAGYVMPLVGGMRPLINYYVPKLRRRERPLFNYYYLVTTALNVASAVRALHERGYVIGDVNESNILVAETALATIVDTDSFQAPDLETGLLHRCLVGKAEFTPPELQGKDFKVVDRVREHDQFGLGVVLFQLLMEGTHPFDGIYPAAQEWPEIQTRIFAGHFPHGSGAGASMRPKPIAPPFGMLDAELQRLFVQCFREGHDRPAARPDAAAWRQALSSARERMRTCAVNEEHRYWGHVPCPWCARKRLLGGMDPFPSKQAVRAGQHQARRSVGARTPPAPPRPAAMAPVRLVQPWAIPARAPVVVSRSAATNRTSAHYFARLIGAGIALVMLLVFLYAAVTPPIGSYKVSSFPVPSPASSVDFKDSFEAGKSYRNTLGARMVWIEPGSFEMGDRTGHGDADEKPAHQVRLTSGFWLCETVVTNAQWKALMGSETGAFLGGNRPVESVSWDEAVGYCKKLTVQEHAARRLPASVEYGLPTEAQWEYACRAGTTGDFAGSVDAMAWHDTNSASETHDVKTSRPNAWGLYEMHGNVWEWCADWYGNYSDGMVEDATGAPTGTLRVYRGGSWTSPAGYCRSASRGRNMPSFRNNYLGFRLAAVSVGAPGRAMP